MIDSIKRLLRPVAYPPLHAWQGFCDYSRGKLRSVVQELRDYPERRRFLRGETILLQDVHGIRFLLYPFDRENVLHLVRRDYDRAEIQALPCLVCPGSIAFDVGANAGLYSVLLSRLCGPSGRVFAFEPVPDTYWRLRENLVLNRCENVSVSQAAVTDRSGNLRMNLFGQQHAEWNTLGAPLPRRVNGTEFSPSGFIEVEGLSLDAFCRAQGIEHIRFLKVDVEGFELSVFQGADGLLRGQKIDYICFEISKIPLAAAGVNSRDVFQSLEEYGYTAYRFNLLTRRFEGPVRDTPEQWTNLFASWRDLSEGPDVVAKDATEQLR